MAGEVAATTRKPKVHCLKSWVESFEGVWSGVKTFELRRDDRDFQVGDILILQELRHRVGEYTGREIRRRITYIMRGSDAERFFGLQPGFAALAIVPSD